MKQMDPSHLWLGEVNIDAYKFGLERKEAVKRGRDSDCEALLQMTSGLHLNHLGACRKALPLAKSTFRI